MYASKTIIALAVAAAAAPALAYPAGTFIGRDEPALAARQLKDLEAREPGFDHFNGPPMGSMGAAHGGPHRPMARGPHGHKHHHGRHGHKKHGGRKHGHKHAARDADTDASGAFSLGNLLKSFGLKREELELLARADASGALAFHPVNRFPVKGLLGRDAAAADDESGAFNLGKVIKTVAGFILKRADEDESGAFSLGNLLKSIGLKREDLEMIARDDASADESGAFNLGKVIKTVAGFILKRADEDESGAFNLGNLLKSIGLKREELELLARADESGAFAFRPINRLPVNLNRIGRDDASEDESGAFNLGKVIKTVAGFILKRADEDESGAFSLGNLLKSIGLKREELEMLARADESGALAFRPLVHLPVNVNRIARDDATADESGAFNLGKVIKTVAGFILKRADEDESGAFSLGNLLKSIGLKREELEMLARDDASADESGAFNLGKVIKTVAGFILKREDAELLARFGGQFGHGGAHFPIRPARSLNELD